MKDQTRDPMDGTMKPPHPGRYIRLGTTLEGDYITAPIETNAERVEARKRMKDARLSKCEVFRVAPHYSGSVHFREIFEGYHFLLCEQ